MKQTLCLILISVLYINTLLSQQLAFPTAEGYGKYSKGGRGGTVYEVTNLNDSGKGSFRAAVDANEPRTVVFRISGTISLESPVIIRNPFITIADKQHQGRAFVLDTLIENNLVKRVNTDRDVMRYDGIMEKHHHLYCIECDIIEDYVDEELDLLLKEYFKKKEIKGFQIKDIILQLNGTFNKC